MATCTLHRRHGQHRGLVQLLLGLCCVLLLLISDPASAASFDAGGAASALRPRGTPTQQLDDEAMPELQLFDSAGSPQQDELLPPLGPMGSPGLGGDLFGE
ncbi:hypothetical protein [Vulcanococcus limneticus]|uniref:hypothetical protein n=1 Tax=Vulcanococcus limneticus TaxID=2170428 RepID=UPI00398C166B